MVDPAPGCGVKPSRRMVGHMWISELAERSGVAARTVRFYEEKGLLAFPDRTEAGYRNYDEDALERLIFIKSAKSLGLSLGEIGAVLGLADAGERPCERVQTMVSAKIRQIDRQIGELGALRRRLVALDAHEGAEAVVCPIIEHAG